MKPQKKRRKFGWPAKVGVVVLLICAAYGVYKLKFEQPTQLQIEQAVAAKNWRRAASLLRRADLTLDDGRNYYNLGLACMNIGDNEGAIEAFMGADDRNFSRAKARFYIASLYAKEDNAALAMHWLNDSFESGFTNTEEIESDPNLARISKSAEWRALNYGGGYTEVDPRKALDFLVGTWTLTGGRGFGGRTLTITKLMDGAIGETWTGDSPGGATGMYLFDPEAQRWNYSYVDSFGRVYTGAVLTGKQVTVSGTLEYADGTEYLRRVEIRSSSGVIDYFSSLSRNMGQTWDEEDRQRLTPLGDQTRSTF